MKKQILIIGIIVLLVAVGLSGCTETKQSNETNQNNGNTENNRFIGTWKNTSTSGNYYEPENTTMTFSSDGYWLRVVEYTDGSINRLDGTWVLMGHGKLRATLADSEYLEYLYTFSDNDETLTLSPFVGGSSVVYTKQ